MKLETLKIIVGYPAEGVPTKYYQSKLHYNRFLWKFISHSQRFHR